MRSSALSTTLVVVAALVSGACTERKASPPAPAASSAADEAPHASPGASGQEVVVSITDPKSEPERRVQVPAGAAFKVQLPKAEGTEWFPAYPRALGAPAQEAGASSSSFRWTLRAGSTAGTSYTLQFKSGLADGGPVDASTSFSLVVDVVAP